MNKSESKYFNTAVKMNNALIKLIEKKPFEYITIKEICDTAQVNRSTFYLHYDNTSDLLAETTKNLINDFFSHFSVNTSDITHRINTCKLSELNFISEEYLYPYLSYIKDNRHIFYTTITNIQAFKFDKIYQNMFEHIFNPILNRFDYPANHRKYVMSFYLNGLNAIIIEWIKEDCVSSFDNISTVICECIFGRTQDFGSNFNLIKNKNNIDEQ